MRNLLLIALCLCTVCCYNQQAPTAPLASQIRLINGLQTVNITLTVFDGDIPRKSAGIYGGYIQYIYSGEQSYYYEVSISGSNSTLFQNYFVLVPGVSYTYAVTSLSKGVLLMDKPSTFVVTSSYLRVVNCLQGGGSQLVQITAQGISEVAELSNGEITDFFETQYGQYSISIDGFNTNLADWISNTTTLTVYLIGDGTANDTIFFRDGYHLLNVVPVTPSCAGYIEITGVCNCFSGRYTDSYLMQCYITAPDSCFNTTTVTDLDNEVVPFVNWGESTLNADRLNISFYSEIVTQRRTLIETPNPQCSFINSPQYYSKGVVGCLDVYHLNIPFVECGFVKTSSPYEDVFSGTIHVKQIDHVSVGQWYEPRIIDTPFPISITIPKTLTIHSDVTVTGPASLALDAAFVGQTVNIVDHSADLSYLSVVQYPLKIETVEAAQLPDGVAVMIDLVDVNCSIAAPCLQRIDLHINTSTCSISGLYRLAAFLTCREERGCPQEAQDGAEVYLESRIVSRSMCGDVSVNIDLTGNLQTFTDDNFSNQAPAFYPGDSAYFKITTSSPSVTLSSITLNSVYYYGPYIGYRYLLLENNVSAVATSNNFAWGSLDETTAWFSVDVSVSLPSSSEDTVFKLRPGETAWHFFVVIVDIEWSYANGTFAQPGPQQAKRMVLQSPARQGSQFNTQVQIASPSQQPTVSVSSAAAVRCAFAFLFVAALF